MIRTLRLAVALASALGISALKEAPQTEPAKKSIRKTIATNIPRIPVGNLFGQLFWILNRGRHDKLTEPFVQEWMPGSTRSQIGTEVFLDLTMWETLIVKFAGGVGVGPGIEIVRRALGIGGKWHMCRTKVAMHATAGLGATLVRDVANVYLLVGVYWNDCTCCMTHAGQSVSIGLTFISPFQLLDGLIADVRVTSHINDGAYMRDLTPDDSGRFSRQPSTGVRLSLGRVWSLRPSSA